MSGSAGIVNPSAGGLTPVRGPEYSGPMKSGPGAGLSGRDRGLDREYLFHLRGSTWSYVAWAVLYAGLWLIPAKSIPVLFAETLGADFFINISTPFLVGGTAFLYSVLAKRGWQRLRWTVWLFLGGAALVCLIVPLIVIFDAGGWSWLAGTLLFFSRLGWFFHRTGQTREIAIVFARGLAGPWLFMAPALLISAWVVGRNELGFQNLDWVPLFGLIYFGIQAAFEEFMLRLSRKAARSDHNAAPAGAG